MNFRFLLLLSSIASVAGQLLTAEEPVVNLMAPPEVVVYYVNEQAASTACTETELQYIDSKMVPDMDMTLLANNYDTPEWDFTVDATRRKLNATCDWCRTMYTNRLCNAMYNCGFRRQLRKTKDESRKLETDQLGNDLLQSCQFNIMMLSGRNRYLSQTCKTAIASATCHVVFV